MWKFGVLSLTVHKLDLHHNTNLRKKQSKGKSIPDKRHFGQILTVRIIRNFFQHQALIVFRNYTFILYIIKLFCIMSLVVGYFNMIF